MPDIKLITDIARFYGFSNNEFVNKDYYIVELLKLLSTASLDIVFTGGTCMLKAYGLIERMSEDVDFKIKITSKSNSGIRKEMSDIKNQIKEILCSSKDFSIEEPIVAINNNRHLIFTLNYPILSENQILRSRIRLEIAAFPIWFETRKCSISSFITLAQNKSPDVDDIECIDPLETLAEKIIALTRRFSDYLESETSFDYTLLRHVYDIYSISNSKDISVKHLSELIQRISQHDILVHDPHHETKWSKDPTGTIRLVVSELKEKKYETYFEKYTKEMIFGKKPINYYSALDCLSDLLIKIKFQ